jgi:Protein of unknown function (DUF2752)
MAGYVAIHDPSHGGLLPCPFRTITGLWCPGCGLTRATHQLLHGHVVAALHYNLLVLFVLGLIAASWGAWMGEALGRPWAAWRRVPAWTYGAMITVAVGFAVVRNLPGVHGLRG